MKKTQYDKKIDLCKKFGAVKFQKFVFKIEKLKYKLLKKIYPNYLTKLYEKLDKEKAKKLKYSKTKEEQEKIKRIYKNIKMSAKKEFNNEQNANYHINMQRPLEILPYLKWNKTIHKKSLIFDLICLTAIPILFTINSIIGSIILVYNSISIFVNLQCINIQNYNINRIEKNELTLRRIQERKEKKLNTNYEKQIRTIGKTIEKSEDLPTIKDIISNIKTKEEAEKMKEYLMQYSRQRKEDVNSNECQKRRVKL